MTELEIKKEITDLLKAYNVKEEDFDNLFKSLKNRFDRYHRKNTRFR